VMVVIFSRRTLTLDMQKLLIDERREKIEKDLEKSHSKYS